MKRIRPPHVDYCAVEHGVVMGSVELLASPYYKGVPLSRIPAIRKLDTSSRIASLLHFPFFKILQWPHTYCKVEVCHNTQSIASRFIGINFFEAVVSSLSPCPVAFVFLAGSAYGRSLAIYTMWCAITTVMFLQKLTVRGSIAVNEMDGRSFAERQRGKQPEITKRYSALFYCLFLDMKCAFSSYAFKRQHERE